MADPTKYVPGYDYSAFEQNNPTIPKPGGQLDNDFANIATSVDETIDALKDIRRSDGQLNNEIVAVDSLSPPVKAMISAGGYVDIVGENIGKVITVADNIADVGTVAANIINVNKVATIDAAVTAVANIDDEIVDVAVVAPEIPAVAGVAGDIPTVAGVAGDIPAVAGVAGDIPTIAENLADIHNFADVYQGAKAVPPTTRNDGTPLQAGDLYFDTVSDVMRTYTGAEWRDTTAASLNMVPNSFTSDGVGTTFTLSAEPAIAANVLVWVDGVRQRPITDYTVSGTTLTIPGVAGQTVPVDTLVVATISKLYAPADGTVTLASLAPDVKRFLPLGDNAVDMASGATVTLDWANGGYFTLDLTSDTAISFSNVLANGYRFLLLTQDATGGHSVTISGKPLQDVIPYSGSATLVRLDAFSPTKVITTIINSDNAVPLGRYFAGNSSMILGPDRIANILNGATQITVMARVRVGGGTGDRAIFSAEIDGAGSGAVCAALSINSNGRVTIGGRSQAADSFQQTSMPDQLSDGWHTVMGIIDIGGDTLTVGVDGAFAPTAAVTFGAAALTPGTLAWQDRIGAVFGGGAQYWTGDIADVAVFRRALTVAEFQLIHRGVRPDALSGVGPVVYFPMDDLDDGFAVSRVGGLVAKPTTAIAKSDGLPPVMPDIHATLKTEQRFADVRAFRLRAADLVGLSDGAAVASAPLRHSGVAAIQGTAGNQPAYRLLSGRPALRFTATESDYLTADVGKIDIRRGFTAVAIASASGSAGGRILSLSDSTANENGNAVAMTVTEGLIVGQGTSGNAAAFSSYTDYTLGSGVALFAGRFSGIEVCNWLNGVKRNGTVSNATEASDGSFRPPAPPNGLSTQLLQIGRRLHGTNGLHLDGDLYDIILVEGALTDEEVRYLEGVLAWENNYVTLLPASHPWKTVQPSASSAISYIWGGTASSMISRSDAPNAFYLGGPSIIRAGDGLLYCLHDTFDPTYLGTISRLHVSRDDGATWHPVATFDALEWGTLWEHTDGHFYIMGVNRGWGDVVLGKSTDRGRSWTWTTLSSSGGPLAPAGSGTTPPNYHSAPGLPPLYHDGYIFKAFDNLDPYTRETTGNNGFKAFVLYVPDGVDLMNKANWQVTSQLAIGAHSFGADAGFFEGQVVVDDNDAMWIIYRFEGQASAANKGVFIPLTWNGSAMTMPAWSATFIKDLPGGNVKVPVFRYGDHFYIVANQDVSPLEKQRNRSVLLRASAADLSAPNFTVHQVLVDQAVAESSTGMNSADSIAYHGFQYAGFFIEEGVVHVAYRLAWSGANSYHNSNFVGYGRFNLAP